MNNRKNKKFDLERALYDVMSGIAKENRNQSVKVFTEILQKTGITPDMLKPRAEPRQSTSCTIRLSAICGRTKWTRGTFFRKGIRSCVYSRFGLY
jgi:hypothetical protein